MAIYAIGDVQGCFDELLKLLDIIRFDPSVDQLWFAGDLVNRGPKSLQTLRFVKGLGKSAITVLGNHDLHLLATANHIRKAHGKDTLQTVLEAPDRDELLLWLRQQPLFHYNDDFCLLHAGLPPQWDFAMARKMALKVENVLKSPDYQDFLQHMYGNTPDIWNKNMKGMDRLRFITNCFTRMRYCTLEGQLDFKHKGALTTQPQHLLPWFTVPARASRHLSIIFGHWSTLGYYQKHNCYGLDTGCLWGGELTAIRLGKKIKRYSVKSMQAAKH